MSGPDDEMHYVLTIQWLATAGLNIATTEGTIRPAGRTRQQLYLSLFDEYIERRGAADQQAVTLHFGLEPNRVASGSERVPITEFSEWGYSEDCRLAPRGYKSTEHDPDAEQWARENAAEWSDDGGRVFRRTVTAWAVDRGGSGS